MYFPQSGLTGAQPQPTLRVVQDVYDSWRERITKELGDRPRSWLARESGLEPSTITRILNGAMPPSDTAKWRIAGALGKRVDELFWFPNVVPQKTWLTESVAS